MIELTNTKVFNFEGAFRGLRNPMNSWAKSDSCFGITSYDAPEAQDIAWEWADEENKELKFAEGSNELSNLYEGYLNWLFENSNTLDYPDNCLDAIFIGPNDMKLAQRMVGGGAEEAKFLRQIFVSVDINGPFAWWKEMDTYKIGTTANSCSTMHKLTSNEISSINFAFNNAVEDFNEEDQALISNIRTNIVTYCEMLRQRYLETKDKRIWRALIEILPEAWMQKRTWTANYQVLRNIYFQRRHHKLEEWRVFCKWIETLPYAKELICYEKEVKNEN